MEEKIEISLEEFVTFTYLTIHFGQSFPAADTKRLLCGYIEYLQKNLNKNED